MTEKDLISRQNLIHKMIQIKAKNLYDAEKIEPIYDGVCDPKKYSESTVKIMWVLKEPYDDVDNSGNPMGGGWNIYEKWTQEDKIEEVSSNRTWHPVMYVLRSIFEDRKWDDLSWIRDERDEYVEALRNCAYININKMPAGKVSGDLTEQFAIWCDEINAQILAYQPDVIIFGNTMCYFYDQCYMRKPDLKECEGISGATDVFLTQIGENPTLLINAYHPNQRTITRQEYVDSILMSVRQNIGKLGKSNF